MDGVKREEALDFLAVHGRLEVMWGAEIETRRKGINYYMGQGRWPASGEDRATFSGRKSWLAYKTGRESIKGPKTIELTGNLSSQVSFEWQQDEGSKIALQYILLVYYSFNRHSPHALEKEKVRTEERIRPTRQKPTLGGS